MSNLDEIIAQKVSEATTDIATNLAATIKAAVEEDFIARLATLFPAGGAVAGGAVATNGNGHTAKANGTPTVVVKKRGPKATAVIKGKSKRDMSCIAEGCKNKSKGPRFRFLCKDHEDESEKTVAAWKEARKAARAK